MRVKIRAEMLKEMKRRSRGRERADQVIRLLSDALRCIKSRDASREYRNRPSEVHEWKEVDSQNSQGISAQTPCNKNLRFVSFNRALCCSRLR